MGELLREIQRLRLRADCFRNLARHTNEMVERGIPLDMAEEEVRKIAEATIRNEAPGELVRLEAHRRLPR